LLTCITPPLLSPQRLEGDVLEASHLRLQKTQVHERGAAVVLALGLLHTRPRDPEDRVSPAVHPAHLDSPKFAPADEPQGSEEEVVGLQHLALPWTAGGEVGYVLGRIEGEPVSPLISGRRPVPVRQDLAGGGPPASKTVPPENLSRVFSLESGRSKTTDYVVSMSRSFLETSSY
jgi:hypothetical protein